MKTDDDDFLTGPIPDPDAEPTAAERAHAKAFSELVDKTLASGRMPPAMSADDRALLEVATVIRATHGSLELPLSKQRSVVEDALRQAVGGGTGTSLSSGAPVVPMRRRWVPWAIATTTTIVAAAAIILLIIRRPKVEITPVQPTAQAAPVPEHWKSRPADPLIGWIVNECGGVLPSNPDGTMNCAREATVKTSARIDTIFSDRLSGYRDRRFARRGGKR